MLMAGRLGTLVFQRLQPWLSSPVTEAWVSLLGAVGLSFFSWTPAVGSGVECRDPLYPHPAKAEPTDHPLDLRPGGDRRGLWVETATITVATCRREVRSWKQP